MKPPEAAEGYVPQGSRLSAVVKLLLLSERCAIFSTISQIGSSNGRVPHRLGADPG